MAGNNKTLHEDPAFLKYANLNSFRYRFFRWTPRTAKFNFIYAFAIPVMVGYVAYASEGKYEFRGKRRGDPIREF